MLPDLLGHKAASLNRVLLDPGYLALLPDRNGHFDGGSDVRLRAALETLADAARNEDEPGWAPVRRLLTGFGANLAVDGAAERVRRN